MDLGLDEALGLGLGLGLGVVLLLLLLLLLLWLLPLCCVVVLREEKGLRM